MLDLRRPRESERKGTVFATGWKPREVSWLPVVEKCK